MLSLYDELVAQATSQRSTLLLIWQIRNGDVS
jgi:hypothetical protein